MTLHRLRQALAALVVCVLVGAGSAAAQDAQAVMSRGEALEAVVSDDWTQRVVGLRALLDHVQPGDEPLLANALGDAQPAVVQAAADALAALGTDEALTVLDGLLADRDAARREMAALAWVRHRLDLDDARIGLVELQLVSDLGRRWLAGRATMIEIQTLRRDGADALAAVEALTTRDDIAADCLREEAAVVGVELDVVTRDRADRFWREGRLDRLPDELLRLQLAVDLADSLVSGVEQRCAPEGALDAGDTEDEPIDPTSAALPVRTSRDPERPFLSLYRIPAAEMRPPPSDSLILTGDGFVGHDNDTFLLTPALRVTEPGPFQGRVAELERDDTFAGGHGALTWVHPVGDRLTVLDRMPLRRPRDRPDVLLLSVGGGYEGRLRWGQLAGAEVGGELVADWFSPSTITDLQRWRVELDGGLEVPGWREEHDLTVTPVQRAGGHGRLAWTDYALAPTRERDGVAALEVALDAEGWHSVEPTDDAQGVIPPEDWWQRTHGTVLWNPLELDEDIWLGLGAELSNRLSQGDFGHGSAAEARVQVTAAGDSEWRLTVGAGYGVAVPWGESAAQTAPVAVDAPDADRYAYRIEREVEHEPVIEARYELRHAEESDDTIFMVDLAIAHRLALAGRDGWSAATDSITVGFHIDGVLGLRYANLELFARRASYDRGVVLLDDVALDGLDDESERVVAGFAAAVPLYIDEYVATTVNGEGRLASSTPRFEGRFEGQFRVLLMGTFAWDLLDNENLYYHGGPDPY